MLRDGSKVDVDGGSWNEDPKQPDWREVDNALRGLAKRRAALDADEARWLRAAEQLEVWREFGCVSVLEYLERRLGYGPRAAQDRLRVARALEELPELAAALETGELHYAAVRELTRVATPETECEWLDDCRDKTVHEIEKRVSGHKRGSRPSDPPDPELKKRILRIEARPATYARYREAHQKLNTESGEQVDEDQLLEAMCCAFLERGTDGDRGGRARYQIAVSVCPRCNQATQTGGGVEVAIDAADLARARCDAQHIGSLDAAQPERAEQDIPPRVRRFVHRRDKGKCALPGCRSTVNLDVHHIVARADGGDHDPKNLMLLCGGHHRALHEGLLTITGEAPDKLVIRREREPDAHAGAESKLEQVTLDVQAKSALVNLGFKKHEAAAAVAAARARAGAMVSLETLIRDALKATNDNG